jgi:hypothetical protein
MVSQQLFTFFEAYCSIMKSLARGGLFGSLAFPHVSDEEKNRNIGNQASVESNCSIDNVDDDVNDDSNVNDDDTSNRVVSSSDVFGRREIERSGDKRRFVFVTDDDTK